MCYNANIKKVSKHVTLESCVRSTHFASNIDIPPLKCSHRSSEKELADYTQIHEYMNEGSGTETALKIFPFYFTIFLYYEFAEKQRRGVHSRAFLNCTQQ